ncbi:SDR family oxidoreductase [Aureispira anguillae]|uniref:SDR family oxidoreductase n=1 Tax=Aureispira anguillae TaxID=2864201 RepID=A0A915YB41_9BACT|nr:SDR family oxidoreductase [Aureispira anguillae]BDS09815.1 SDR family oxidoreductase [Aureispira anguillae]
MQKQTVYVFFSEANSIEANQIITDLKKANVNCIIDLPTVEKVEHITQNKEATGLLLVSDNYLKSIDETRHLDQLLAEEYTDQLIPILTHGRRPKNGAVDQVEVYPTQIQTLNNVMYYRDFWYEEWIALRKKSKNATSEEREELDELKEIAKKMSVGSISTFIRKINNIPTVDWDDFCANDYQVFFDKTGLDKTALKEQEENVVENEFVDETPQEEISKELETPTVEQEEVVVAAAPIVGTEENKEEQEEIPAIEEEIDEEILEEIEEEVTAFVEETNTIEEELSEEEEPLELEEAVVAEMLEEVVEQEEEQEAIVEQEEEAPFSLEGLENLEEVDADAILEQYTIDEVEDVDILFHIAESQAEDGEFDEARHCYERILKIDPYNGRALIWLARLLTRHYEDEILEAAQMYRKAIMVNDENAGLYYEYALVQKDHFQAYNKASDSFREALLIDSSYEDAYLGLAQCQREMGMLDQAKANYLQACVLDAPRFQTTENDDYFGVIRMVEAVEEEEIDATVLEEREYPASPNANTVVMVTGASSGIGRAIAGQFIMGGYKVIITGRRTERLNDFKEMMEEHLEEAQIHTLSFDVGDLDAVKAAVDSLPEGWADIDILINNAGLAKGFAPVHEGNVEHWETMIDTNIKGLLYMSRVITPEMVKRQKGHVINLGSVAGTQVYAGGGVYCATKAAVDSLTRSMRLDLYEHNIKVTSVSPGHVDATEFATVRYEDSDKAKIYEDFKPLSAKDVADTVYYIATRPEHVNIQDVLMFGTQQASVRDVNRSGRKED